MESHDSEKPVLPTKSKEGEGVSPKEELLIGLKRDPESVDDFEHLEAELSPLSDQSIKQLKEDVSETIDRLNNKHEKIDSVVNGASHISDKLIGSSGAEMDFKSVDDYKAVKTANDDIISSSQSGIGTVHSTQPFGDTFGNEEGEILQPSTQVVSEIGDAPKVSNDADTDVKSKLDKEFESYTVPQSHTEMSSHESPNTGISDSTIDVKDLKEIVDIGNENSSYVQASTEHETSSVELGVPTISTDQTKEQDKDMEDLLSNLRESVLQEITKESKELSQEEENENAATEVLQPQSSVLDIPEQKEPAPDEESSPIEEAKEEPLQVEKIATKAELETDVKKTEQEIIKPSTPPPVLSEAKKETVRILNTVNPGAWFNPDRLDPKVAELVYWRDPKKSGAVFGGILVILLSLSYFSLISVIAYLSLLLLAVTVSFRIYKNVLQAVQKTQDGHPFKEYLDVDLTLSEDQVQETASVFVTHLNGGLSELRRLFLVEDLVDSIKFGVLLWCLTYLGAWFNGMTLIIIGFVGLFTLPKVYENNKEQIDQHLDVVRTKVSEIMTKVKAAVPIGKKEKDKEQ